MKKANIKKSKFGVNGPFEKARANLANFTESAQFSALIQKTIEELKNIEEEYEMALFMDQPELAKQKKAEQNELLATLAYASTLLENENGISA
tara:strand:+ start:1947 stop:2225 length:279 start_codon:yes stop_codon:yes gene_type:complete